MPNQKVAVTAPLWVQKNSHNFLGSNRITLLEQIDIHGSLSSAAKAAGMSYKTAWDALNVMNNLADRPLTVAATGGSGGGGTCLTDEGRKVVKLFRMVEREHLQALARLEESIDNFDSYLPLLRRITMRISAKNVFSGIVCEIIRDVSVAQVVLQLKSGNHITAVVSDDSIDSLGLAVGNPAYALVKASSIMIANTPGPLTISAKNLICGRITGICESVVLGEVVLDIGAGETITATITESSVKNLALKEGNDVWAVIKATSVIIGSE
ncbi:MAG: TOBE domain-containing protein [Desulfuromusa sp.]|jgi:molybdate transport system regulatory protein|nr:TOBE domain-containing protein [Desulfuromusa sp.]